MKAQSKYGSKSVGWQHLMTQRRRIVSSSKQQCSPKNVPAPVRGNTSGSNSSSNNIGTYDIDSHESNGREDDSIDENFAEKRTSADAMES